MSAVKVARAVPVAKAVKADRADKLVVKVAVVDRPSSASVISSSTSISIFESLETRFVAERSRAFTK